MLKLNDEYYCTLFDSVFFPLGLTMIHSLLENQKNAYIFVLCMDTTVHISINKLLNPRIKVILLEEIEKQYPELLKIKNQRTRGEYCWTMTPVLLQFIILKYKINRITYLDSDLYFFSNPNILIQEMIDNHKHVLITEHAYDSKYDQSNLSGKFCVQFMTFNNTLEGLKVLQWWKEKCIEWCYARHEDGKFGDQKYLDVWPIIFNNEVHILSLKDKTLAPWNVSYFSKKGLKLEPVFYHFHGFRIQKNNKAILFNGYYISKDVNFIYETYLIAMRQSLIKMNELNIEFSPFILRTSIRTKIGNMKRFIFSEFRTAYI